MIDDADADAAVGQIAMGILRNPGAGKRRKRSGGRPKVGQECNNWRVVRASQRAALGVNK